MRSIEASGAEVVTVAVRRVDLDREQGREHPSSPRSDPVFPALQHRGLLHRRRGDPLCSARARRRVQRVGEAGSDRRPETLLPDTAGLLEATRSLAAEGFKVLAYTNDDLITALRLEDAGAVAVMPLASPIGSGLGMLNPYAIRTIKQRLTRSGDRRCRRRHGVGCMHRDGTGRRWNSDEHGNRRGD